MPTLEMMGQQVDVDDSFLNLSPEDQQSTVNDIAAKMANNKQADSSPEVSGSEAFGRGAAQAFGLGYSPQAIAALKTGNIPGSDDPKYAAELAKQKAATEQAWEQHPWLYGTGMAVSAVPALANAVLGGPEELAAAGTIGGLGGLGLRAAAGEGAGFVPSALRGTAAALENPVVQGGIMGSSEGDDFASRAAGAAFGAAGAKIAPMALGAAGSAAKSIVSKVAPEAANPILTALAGNPTAAQQAGDLASKAKTSLGAGVVSGGPLQTLATKADFFGQLPASANQTLGEIGKQISDFSGTVDRKSAGAAVRDAVQNWATDPQHPNGFAAQMSKIYEPVNALQESSAVVPITNVSSALSDLISSPYGRLSPTGTKSALTMMAPALDIESQNGGLTFSEMQALKKILSDKITWNQAPGESGVDNNVLKGLRAALNKDMSSYAETVGGDEIGKAYSQVNAQAQKLYDQRDSIFRITGNPIANAPGSKSADSIYSNIIRSAAKRGGQDTANLANLKQAVSQYAPDAWSSIGKAYASDLAPNGQFTYNNFNKLYDGYFRSSPTNPTLDGKSLIFGQPGSGGARDMLDAFHNLGAFNTKTGPLGQKLDNLAAKSGNQPSLATAILESTISGGVPWKSALAGTAGTAASRVGARNIAAPLPSYTPSVKSQAVANALKRPVPLIGAQALNPIGNAPNQYQQPIARATGGRVCDKLISDVERAKKLVNKRTEPLLNADDTHVARALEIANQNFGN